MMKRISLLLLALLSASSANAQNTLLRASDIGSTVQAYDADVSAFAACAGSANTLCYSTGAGTMSSASLTAAGRAVAGAADASAQRTALGLAIGTDVAAQTHATQHKSGGTDAIKLDELAAPTDVTTLNASTTAHGLLPKLTGSTSNYLRADGTWTAPTASMAIGSAVTSGTSCSALYVNSSGNLAQDNAAYCYDAANDRLGLGTNSPSYRLHLADSGTGDAAIVNSNSGGASGWRVTNDAGTTGTLRVYGSAYSLGLGNTIGVSSSGDELHMAGGSGASGVTSSFQVRVGGYDSSQERLRIDHYGNVLIGTTTRPTSAQKAIALVNGTAPTGNVTDGISLYAQDVSSSSELKVRDEAGNVTTLSPHNFSRIPGGRSEPMAWSYYSERDGQYVAVDMLRAMRVLEQLSGEQLVHIGSLSDAAPANDTDVAVAAIEREVMRGYPDADKPQYRAERADLIARIEHDAPIAQTDDERLAVESLRQRVATIDRDILSGGTDAEKARVMALHAQLSQSRASMQGALDAYAAVVDAGSIAVPAETAAKVRALRQRARDGELPGLGVLTDADRAALRARYMEAR